MKWEYLKVLILNFGTLGYIIVSPPNLLKGPVISVILYGLVLGQTFFVGMHVGKTDETKRLPVVTRTFIYSGVVLLAIYLFLAFLLHYRVLGDVTAIVFYVAVNAVGAVLIIGSAMTLGIALSFIVKVKRD